MIDKAGLIRAAVLNASTEKEWRPRLAKALRERDPWARYVVIHSGVDGTTAHWFERSSEAVHCALALVEAQDGGRWRLFHVRYLLGDAIHDAVLAEVPRWDEVFP